MKTLYILLFVLYSCAPCADCTRTWTITTRNGSTEIASYSYIEEPFEVCHGEEIREAEDESDIMTKYMGNGIYKDSSWVCRCVYQ